MAIFTRHFADADEYEEWLKHVSARGIKVLSIVNSPTVFDSSIKQARQPGAPVVVKYQTHDESFAPARGATVKAVEYAIVVVAFFALFAYVIAEL